MEHRSRQPEAGRRSSQLEEPIEVFCDNLKLSAASARGLGPNAKCASPELLPGRLNRPADLEESPCERKSSQIQQKHGFSSMSADKEQPHTEVREAVMTSKMLANTAIQEPSSTGKKRPPDAIRIKPATNVGDALSKLRKRPVRESQRQAAIKKMISPPIQETRITTDCKDVFDVPSSPERHTKKAPATKKRKARNQRKGDAPRPKKLKKAEQTAMALPRRDASAQDPVSRLHGNGRNKHPRTVRKRQKPLKPAPSRDVTPEETIIVQVVSTPPEQLESTKAVTSDDNRQEDDGVEVAEDSVQLQQCPPKPEAQGRQKTELNKLNQAVDASQISAHSPSPPPRQRPIHEPHAPHEQKGKQLERHSLPRTRLINGRYFKHPEVEERDQHVASKEQTPVHEEAAGNHEIDQEGKKSFNTAFHHCRSASEDPRSEPTSRSDDDAGSQEDLEHEATIAAHDHIVENASVVYGILDTQDEPRYETFESPPCQDQLDSSAPVSDEDEDSEEYIPLEESHSKDLNTVETDETFQPLLYAAEQLTLALSDGDAIIQNYVNIYQNSLTKCHDRVKATLEEQKRAAKHMRADLKKRLLEHHRQVDDQLATLEKEQRRKMQEVRAQTEIERVREREHMSCLTSS